MVFHKLDVYPPSVSERRGFGASAGFSRQRTCVCRKRMLFWSSFGYQILVDIYFYSDTKSEQLSPAVVKTREQMQQTEAIV